MKDVARKFLELLTIICNSATKVELCFSQLSLHFDFFHGIISWTMLTRNMQSVLVNLPRPLPWAVAVAIQRAVNEITPWLHCTCHEYSQEPQQGMDLICWIMFDMQQQYFLYMHHMLTWSGAATVPMFTTLIDQGNTFCASNPWDPNPNPQTTSFHPRSPPWATPWPRVEVW